MALVNVVNMVVLDNPTCFTSPFQFEITFECLQELDDDLEWKVLYVGSAQDAAKDQILDEILVGPVPVGVNKFVLQADAPDPSQLAQDDLLGVTVVLVTCSYKEREFVRVGYYVNNEYHDPNAAASSAQASENDGEQQLPPPIPNPVPLDRIQRQILADKPRVTKFPISWGDEPLPQQQQRTNNNNNSPGIDANNGTMATAAGSSVGAAMMADHAASGTPTATTGSAAMLPPPAMVTPSIPSKEDDEFAHGGNSSNAPAVDTSMMREEEEIMEDEDIMEEEELSVDSETGEQAGDGVVSMPEESNMSHSYFGNHHTTTGNTNGSNVQAMAE